MGYQADIHNGDWGTVLTVTLIEAGAAVDISSTTTRQFIITRPDKTILTVTAVFVTNGTDGQLTYTTVAGDINQSGLYSLEAKVIYSTGQYYSYTYSFNVLPNLVNG